LRNRFRRKIYLLVFGGGRTITHVLFIPKQPTATLNDLTIADAAVIGKLLLAATTGQGARLRRQRLSLRDDLRQGRRSDRLPNSPAPARRSADERIRSITGGPNRRSRRGYLPGFGGGGLGRTITTGGPPQ